ncbi:fungal hydrophobin-domain-containing protein [Crassisporium funariophilum]|nr:fungal hydrophobin-domain-containing protein [Crassisporium funariophilum]
MQFKLLSVLALATIAVATPTRRSSAPPASQCNTGPVQCCNSVQAASDKSLASVFGLLNIVAAAVTGEVGVTCSPVTVIGASGNSCSAQPVCCTNNSFNGLIALGCTPVNVNL